MLFSDAVFEITPLQGEVWAHSEVEVTVTCRPDVAAEFAASAFLDVVGLEDRLELSLAGRGIGLKIALTFDALDIGEVFINSQHRYQLQVSNRGDIPAAWRTEAPPSSSASRFSFGPRRGSSRPASTPTWTCSSAAPASSANSTTPSTSA